GVKERGVTMERKQKKVEEGVEDQLDVMRIAGAVERIGIERAEEGEARGVSPELLAQQADNEDRFHQPVAEQIESVEIVLGDGEGAGEVEQVVGDPVVPVLDQLAIAPAIDCPDDGPGADEVKREAAGDLDQRVEP